MIPYLREGRKINLLYYLAFGGVVGVALYTTAYAAKVWRLANRRGAIGLFLLSGGLVVLGWWILFAEH
ncbi:MAG: hypothetical protein QME79_03795 [Bacillota bacterium]|nr:hypothetical protein [Bacillota bacterium]